MKDSFAVPTKQQRFSLEIKRSRFITTVACAESREQALQVLAELRLEFADANHHCWAMVAGHPDNDFVCDQSDDGEPRGTAGKPMLNALRHSGMGKTMVVVTRYFGGVKLGAGGLVRAYTQSVVSALEQTATRINHVCVHAVVELPYGRLDEFEHWLKSTQITFTDRHFTDQVKLELSVPVSEQPLLLQAWASQPEITMIIED